MSKISSLIDELRKSEDEWNGSNMFELARMCREAADTIWELRDDLQRANAENAKLRELVRVFYHCTTSGVCDECPVNGGGAVHLMPDTICDTMHDRMRELGVDA